MLSAETVRTAVLSPKPWSALDRLVREQLATGRLKNQIRDDLIALEDQLLETTSNNEDAADALHDIIDALAGMCPAKYAYENPPVLPTEEEITKLPRWARVAFAARCARRVCRLVPEHWEAEPSHHLAVAIKAVNRAELAAQGKELNVQEIELLGQNENARKSAFHTIPMNGSTKNDVVTHALNSSTSALFAAASPDHPLGVKEAMRSADFAIAALVMLNADYTPINLQLGTEAIRRDFDQLSALSRSLRWVDSTPVAPDAFGPMWLKGMPKGWPQEGLEQDFVLRTSREPESLVSAS